MGAITWAVVRFTRPGFHRWPAADTVLGGRRAYLGQIHRHLFHVEARVQVVHGDREIEFHELLDFCTAQFTGGNFGTQSCEMLASALRHDLETRHPGRLVTVSVFEDGEVGAVVENSA